MEELGDARLRCDQLIRYLDEAVKLVEQSKYRDHFFEVAGHLITGLPEAAFKLQKALQAVALAADRLDYEEVKQELRPEKVEELERVLQDVRIRQIRRRSEPPMNYKDTAERLRLLAAKIKESQAFPVVETLLLASELEGQQKVASNREVLADFFEGLATSLDEAQPGEMSRAYLAKLLRRVTGENLQVKPPVKQAESEVTALSTEVDVNRLERALVNAEAQVKEMRHSLNLYKRDPGRNQPQLSNLVIAASSAAKVLDRLIIKPLWGKLGAKEEDRESRFEEGKPADPTKDMSPEDAKKWREQNRKHRDEFKGAAGGDPADLAHEILEQGLRHPALKEITRSWSKVEADLKKAETEHKNLHRFGVGSTEDVTLVNAHIVPALKSYRDMVDIIIEQISKRLKRRTASEEDRESRFEEGKPADPTKNMSPEDAKKWKEQNDRHKDKFKSADAQKESAKWIQKAIKDKGALHRHFGIPEDETIPTEKIKSELAKLKKKEDKSDADKKLQHQLNMALTLRGPKVPPPGGKKAGDEWKVEAVEVTAALKPKDKKVVDAFADKKPMDGDLLDTDGKKLEKSGLGGGTFAEWKGGKIHILSPGGNRSHDAILRYMKKSIPKNDLADHPQLRAASDPWKAAALKFKPGDKVRVKDSHGSAKFRGDTGEIEKNVPMGKYYVQLKKNGRSLVDEGDLEKA
jgi:hypothetical protein